MTNGRAARLWLVGCVLLAACAGAPVEPEPVPLDVAASTTINPHTDGQAQSVDLLILQLASADRFRALDLPALYPQLDKPRQALGADLLASELLRLTPGQALEVELEIDPRTRYVGVVAAFEQYQRAAWRGLAELGDETTLDQVLFRDQRLKIVVDELSVEVTVGR